MAGKGNRLAFNVSNKKYRDGYDEISWKTNKMYPNEVILEKCEKCGHHAIHPTLRHCMKCKI